MKKNKTKSWNSKKTNWSKWVKKIVQTVKNNPFVVLLAAILGIAAALSSSFGYFENVHDFFSTKLSYGSEYTLLNSLKTGLPEEFVTSLLKTPPVSIGSVGTNYTRRTYERRGYELTIVFDENKTIEFYSVVSLSSKFHPILKPNLGQLTKTTFDGALGDAVEPLCAGKWSKGILYCECIDLGNPGHYDTVYLVLRYPVTESSKKAFWKLMDCDPDNMAPIDSIEDKEGTEDFLKKYEAVWKNFRKVAKFDSFGYGRGNLSKQEICKLFSESGRFP